MRFDDNINHRSNVPDKPRRVAWLEESASAAVSAIDGPRLRADHVLMAVFSLEDRAAVITGAASGIGAATARVFAEAGADVVLGWFPGDPHDIDGVRQSVVDAGRRAITVEIDVRSDQDVNRLVASCVEQFGRVDVAVANAGVAPKIPLDRLDGSAWNATLDLNLTGAWRLFRAAVPHMCEARFGRLLATSSEAGTVSAWPEHSHYAAAKAGLVGLIRNLAVEYGRFGVTANAVAPGTVESPQSLDAENSMGPEGIARVIPHIPVRRVGIPDDVAHLYRFLASEEAGYLNGATIVIDGGLSLVSESTC
jgi:3-oxoacyl-[acyl-carrier protein] reductase